MPRFFRIIIHLFVFLTGLCAVVFTDFWNWELFQGLVSPIVSTGFFLYMVIFLATGEYRVFSSRNRKA